MTTPNLTIYDFDQVTCALGPILVDGFAEGTGISIEVNPTFIMKRGADGKVTRSKSLDIGAIVKFSVMQSSAAMALLGALHILDRNAPNGAGIVPLYIRDKSGTSVYTAAQAWIAKAPDITFGTEASAREWEIHVPRFNRVDGGN